MVCSKLVHSGCSVKWVRSNKKAIRNEVQKSNVWDPSA